MCIKLSVMIFLPVRASKRLHPAGAGSCRKSYVHGQRSSAARWGSSEQNAAANLFLARSALRTEVFKGVLKCKACERVCSICSGTSPSCKHKREVPAPREMLSWENGRGRCGSTIWRSPDEQREPSRAERQQDGDRFWSFTRCIVTNPGHWSSALSGSDATAKAASPFHRPWGFSNLFVTQLCSEESYFFF